MHTTKKISAVFATLLLMQTLATPTLSLAQETVPEVVLNEKEEDTLKELLVETAIEESVKESEGLPEKVGAPEEKETGEEILEVPAVKNVEAVFTPLTEKEAVAERESSTEGKNPTDSKQTKTIIEKGSHGTAKWELDSDGTLTFGEGDLAESTDSDSGLFGNIDETNRLKVKKIVFTAPITANTKQGYFFSNLENLETIEGLELWDISNVTDMSYMFALALSLTSLDLTSWNTENVTDISYMFALARSLTNLDLSSWNTENVTDMSYMFYAVNSLTSLDLASWNTENVTDMSYMFFRAHSLMSLDLTSWNTKNVTDMSYMFSDARSLTSLDLSSWNTENVTDMSYMFYGADSLTSLDLASWDTRNVTNMYDMFRFAPLKRITLGDKFTLRDNTRLASPGNASPYTGNWISTDGTIDYSSSEDLLSLGTQGKGVKTFVWERSDMRLSQLIFNLNNGEGMITQNLLEGERLKEPETPIRAGHEFLGWFTEGDKKWDFEKDTMPASDLELYAHWKAETYKVTFNLNGGTGDFEEPEVEVGAEITKPANDPSRAGYQFLGWFTEKEDGDQWDFENNKMPAYDFILYAHWKETKQVTFLDVSGDQTVEILDVPTGERITTPPQGPDRTGYTFIGWSTTKTSGSLWNFATDKVMEDTTLYARYVLDDVAIIYQNNYSDLDTSDFYTDEIRYNSVLRTPLAPTRAGYAFQGWYTARTGGNLWNFNDKVAVEGTFTLYARWAAVYTVTFKNSDGKVLKTQSVVHGNTAQAPTNPTRKDYTFTGWDKGFTNITGHLTVTAKHKAINVSFKPSVTSKTIGKKKAHTLSVKSLNVAKNRTEYTIDKKYSKLASVNKTTGKVTTKDKTGTFKVNVKVFAQNGTTKTVSVTYKTIHHVTDVLTDKGKKLATKASIKKGKTTTIKTKAISSKKTQKATSPKTTYKTSNKKVATVDKKGKIKGIKKGTATITITTTTADGAKVVKKVKVTVK